MSPTGPGPLSPLDEGRIIGQPSSSPRYWLIRKTCFAVCLLLLIAGITLLADDYGQSWDDHGDAKFGTASLRAYIGDPAFLHGHGNRIYYGPFYFMLSQAIVRLGQFADPSALAVDIRHVLNALMLLLAAVALYWLSVRLTTRPSAAIVTVLLFGLQPVVFGHAFINQKDTPFMALFVLAVATGIMATDASRRAETSGIPPATSDGDLPRPSRSHPTWRSMVAPSAVGLVGVALLVALLRGGLLYQVLTELLGMAYSQTGPSWLNAMFRAAAQDAYKTPFPLYQQKLSLVYAWTSAVLGLVILAVLVMSAMRWLPPSRAKSLRRDLRIGLFLASAGVVLGVCTSTRPLGLFAGALVMLYTMLHPGRRTAAGMGVYLAAGAAAAYLVWPFLWAAPLANLMAAVQLFLDFDPHIVLFNGIHYTSTDLPRTYLPWLLAIQLTEAALLAVAGGAVITIRRLSMRHPAMDLLIVILAWFVIPLAYVVLLRPSIYGSFRQFLFILPPLFLVAGLAVEWLFAQLRHRALHVLTALLLLAPGSMAIAQLHPYEYIYYNSTVGGVSGAAGQFELDYWCTSYRGAMEFVNEHAREGALVAVNAPLAPARTFARPDLSVELAPTSGLPEFSLVCDEQPMMDRFYPEMKTVFVVMADGVALAEVKQRPPANGSEANSP